MIRRFLYHSFWNFYDYLGTYFLLGALSTLVMLGLIAGFGEVIGRLDGGGKVVFLGLLALVLWLAASEVFAGAFRFGDKAAQDLPARLPDMIDGGRRLFGRYLACTFFLSLGIATIAANMFFYSQMAANLTAPIAIVLAALGAAFMWLGLSFGCYALVLLAVAGTPEALGFRFLLKRALVYLALAPGLWLFVFVGSILFVFLCILSRVGVIFILPFVVCGATTAARLVQQHFEFLAEAHGELGTGHPVRHYKAKALELGWQWEYRQQRRTFREIIKPWEY